MQFLPILAANLVDTEWFCAAGVNAGYKTIGGCLEAQLPLEHIHTLCIRWGR